MLVKLGLADGLVAGSIASTGDMLRAAFHTLGTEKGVKTASSCFIMDLKEPTPAGDSVVAFGDVAFYLLLVFAAIGVFAGTFGSIIMIRKYLKREGNEILGW